MQADQTNGAGRRVGVAAVLLTIALIILGLVYGRSFLVPLVIAFLISLLIGAGADRLRRLGLPWPLPIAGSVLAMLVGIAAVVNVVASQVDDVAAAWPRYVQRFQVLSDSALSWLGPGISAQITEAFSNLDLMARLPGIVGSAGGFVATVLLVIIYVGFLLAERGSLEAKIDHLFYSPERAAHMKRVAADVADSIRRYVWIKTIMALFTSGASYAVLRGIGVDFAETWALLIFLLNYIPSIGAIIGVLFPALITVLQFDTAWQFFVVAAGLASAQIIIGNVIEPTYMGRTLNLSPFIVIASLAFWGMLWGIVGAFLSVPLTTALVIACAHVPAFRWIAVLLSADGLEPLEEEARTADPRITPLGA
jgi:AI-2 transport protein TqsA